MSLDGVLPDTMNSMTEWFPDTMNSTRASFLTQWWLGSFSSRTPSPNAENNDVCVIFDTHLARSFAKRLKTQCLVEMIVEREMKVRSTRQDNPTIKHRRSETGLN